MAKKEVAYLMNNWKISESEAREVLAAIKRRRPILVAGKANNARTNRSKTQATAR